jgi:hypothetical protein
MTSDTDDLEKQLLENLKLRRELGAELAKASECMAKQCVGLRKDGAMPTQSTTEVRQGTGPRAMFWVLIGSLALAVIAGFALTIAFGWLPLPWS